MKKLLLILVVLAAGYLVVGVCAWRVLPGKVAEAERKREGVSLALAKVANDQLAVSQRISEITKQTLGRGQDKAAQVSVLLGDPMLNRMALMYTGADWATAYSSFSGNVKHLRAQQRAQTKEKKNSEDLVMKKVEKIEYRKRQLLRDMNTPRDTAHRHKEEQWQAELRDLDRQLSTLRDSSQYRDKLDKTGSATGRTAENDANGDAVFKLATECEAQTVQRLVRAMSEKSAALEGEGDDVGQLRNALSYFNIWPLNKMANMPLGE